MITSGDETTVFEQRHHDTFEFVFDGFPALGDHPFVYPTLVSHLASKPLAHPHNVVTRGDLNRITDVDATLNPDRNQVLDIPIRIHVKDPNPVAPADHDPLPICGN